MSCASAVTRTSALPPGWSCCWLLSSTPGQAELMVTDDFLPLREEIMS